MKKVLTVGVFDYFHYGHLKLLERAKDCGDYLIVAVQRDEEIHKNKPDATLYKDSFLSATADMLPREDCRGQNIFESNRI